MSFFYQHFVEQKIKIVQAIADSCCGDTYAEGALILCSVISAMSAIAWPGDSKINRKRFVEIIVKYPPQHEDPKKVSLPILVQGGVVCNTRLGVSNKAFHLTENKDLTEANIMKSCPDIKLSEIRKYSYANLLYQEIRNTYAHQYRAGKNSTESDSLRQIENTGKSAISYVNIIRNDTLCRVIYFPLEWIASVARAVASGLDIEQKKLGKAPFDDLYFEVPTKWWLEGVKEESKTG
ncbi:hypothetical protein [Desulfobacterium sp. N47]|uniref:Uncharacterized protein n=1 Tax=uncultured Desulfobacterium sp. TaxID=201089 RepID=E1YC01_9BACT|nr:hypothetical protein N47_G34190 [uncultured Desulfobacterium sp.]